MAIKNIKQTKNKYRFTIDNGTIITFDFTNVINTKYKEYKERKPKPMPSAYYGNYKNPLKN